MITAVALTVWVICMFVWLLDVSADSQAREELTAISKERETERVADECEELDLPLEAAEKLLLIQMIRLNEAWRRLGYTLAPDFLARRMLPIGNPAR